MPLWGGESRVGVGVGLPLVRQDGHVLLRAC